MAKVTMRYWAAARAAAGHEAEIADGGTLGEIIAEVSRDKPELARVLGICTFLVDSARAEPSTVLPEGAVVDALPPFAGG